MLDDLITKLLRIVNQAERIIAAEISWRTKYDLVFSDDIAGAVRDLNIRLEWYDPDTSYEEDVLAYMSAIRERADEFKKIQ